MKALARDLQPFPLEEAMKHLTGSSKSPALIITMAEGQWDGMLSRAYELGWILLELDEDEKPIHAYKRQPNGRQS